MNRFHIYLTASLLMVQISLGDIDRSWSRTDEEIDISYGGAASRRGAASQHRSISELKEKIEFIQKLPAEEAIPILGDILNKMTMKNIFQVPERIEMYDSVQELLISIPGHSEYYRDRINEARLKMEEAEGDESQFAYYSHKLQDRLLFDFPVFENLPSPENVRVLGEFLFDERGYERVDPPRTYDDMARMEMRGPVFGRAARALMKLPIEHKPVPETRYPSYTNPEDVKPWRDWIEEIKAGKRTFRFVGDPTEYDLDGPASKEKVERIAKIRERATERVAGRKQTSGPSIVVEPTTASKRSKPMPVALYIAAMVLLVSMVWYFLRERRTV